ncbi:Z-ring formation inhibitor MciZ [Cohnella cellulosilytica]|uniref:Z-ring formation inhibitor MciZ n=1 Tax=Cohnella cellulosilytica TaxID=986710 RepID=A0ABW2F8P6_9BACL
MLKKYVTPHSLQYVGKAWEIRHALRQEKNQRGEGTPLAALLAGRQAPPRSR